MKAANHKRVRFLLVDDHSVVRRGLMEILGESFRNAQFGEAATAADAMELMNGQQWDLVILDITIPGRSGIDVLKEARSRHPGLPVLVLSIHPAEQYAVRIIKAGAAGYITKDTVPEQLVLAVRAVLSGKKHITQAVGEKLATELEDGFSAEPHRALSDREYEIMIRLAGGRTVSQVARELSLSVKTISTYRVRALDKMHMKTNAEFTRYAVDHGLDT
jgi:DNA-binding NarL/FixJ family response regulator